MKSDKRNSNYRRIEKLIVDSFINLSTKKHYSQISVTELCDEAGVNRTTFYKHYHGTWEIKEGIANNLIVVAQRMDEIYKQKNFLREPEYLFNAINKEIEDNEEYYRSIFNMQGSGEFKNLIVNEIKRLTTKNYPTLDFDNPTTYKVFSIVVGGIIVTYSEWFYSNLKCSLKELSDSLIRYVKLIAPHLPYDIITKKEMG